MNDESERAPSRIVLVVGVDLSEVSEHLLREVRDLVRTVDVPEVHLIHVVPHEPLRPFFSEPLPASLGVVELAQAQSAYWEVHRLWDSLARGSKARVVVHTPVGRAANELTRIAREVGADVIVLEAHARGASRRIFHRSLLARVTRTAPCSVLALRGPTLRKRRPGLLAHPEPITRGLT